jgi:hypothetical protein
MKKYSFLLIIICSNISLAQSVEPDSLSRAKISELAFLSGNWRGSGWMYGQDRQRYEFEQTEDIKFKLDSTILLIEGLGTSKGTTIHNALAVVSFNNESDNYSFNSYLANGRKGEFKAEIIDGKFYWYPMENMRYIIEIDDAGRWYEKGEYNNQGSWFQFFEMTLEKY